MKKLLALALVVFGLAACQTEPEGLDVNMDGATTITVTLPEDAITRAVGGTDSSLGGLANTAGETIRVILKIYDENGNPSDQRQVNYLTEGNLTTNFDVRLIPDREYTFVAWADKVDVQDDVDKFYNTEDLKNVTLIANTWEAMNEGRDAFTATYTESNFTSVSNITLELKRPFAKLRVVTTDMEALRYWNIEPTTATVSYTTPHYTGFNAYEGMAINRTNEDVAHQNYTIHTYTNEDGKNLKTLFTDYFFAAEGQETIQFNIAVADQSSKTIREVTFNTEIPVKRNNLTTIQGNILTDGNNIKVEVKPDFDNGSNWNPEEDNKDIQTISSNAEFADAMTGGSGKYIIVSDDIVISASAQTYAATRAGEGRVISIDLNGKTIIIENNDTNNALFELNDNDALIFSGEGNIEGTGSGKLVEGGTVVVTGAADVDEGVADVKTGVEALEYILANGGEFTFTKDLAISEVLLASTTNPVVINGADFTLTSSATRAIRATVANANIVANDLNIVVTTERVGSNDIRGISIDNVTGVELTLNNCSVIFNHPSGNDWAYAVNVTGGSNHKVTVNGGSYNGANVINVRGSENNIVVKNATLTSLYPNNDMYFGACIYVVQHENSSVYAEGNTFNGDNAWAFNIGYTPIEEKNNTDNTKYVAAKVGSTYYYNVAEAINAAEDGATIKVLQRHDCNVGATVPAGKTLTLDLNGKTVRGKTNGKTNPQDLFLVKGNLTVNNGTITTEHVGDNLGWSAMTTIFDITGGGVVNLNGVTAKNLGGSDMGFVAHLNNWGEVTLNVENSTLESNYVAVRVFNSGYDKNNVTIKNSTLKGGNYAFWVHNYTVADFGTEEKAEAQKALLNFDIFNGTNTFIGKNETPIRYGMTNAIYTEAGEVVSTADELIAALAAGKDVIFANDITVAATNGGYNKAGILQNKAQTINGNGYTLTVTGAGATWDCAIYTNGGLIKNLTVAGAMRGVFTAGTSSDLFMENVTFKNVIYTFNSDGGNKNYGVYISNSTLNGWTSHSDVHKEVVYTNCNFGEGSGYKYCRPYGKTEFVNCTFCAGYTVDKSQTNDITFTDCTWEE